MIWVTVREAVLRRVFHNFRAKWFFDIFFGGSYQILRVKRESDFLGGESFSPEVNSRKIRAKWTDVGLENLADSRLHEIQYREFSDVLVSPNRRGGFLQMEKELLVPSTDWDPPDRIYFPNSSVGGVISQRSREILARRPLVSKIIPNAIFFGSMAPHNWFHWLIDNLPTAALARNLPDKFLNVPVLITEEVTKREPFMEALRASIGSRPYVVVDSNEWVKVRNLIRIDGATRPAPRALTALQPYRVSVFADVLRRYRDLILDQLDLNESVPVPGNRLFIGRKDSAARPYNSREIFETAKEWGFREVFLEDLSFRDSVKLFRESEAIMGPHGAGWATLLFCAKHTKALLWTWPGELEDNWYENLAMASEVDYRQIFMEFEPRRNYDDPRVASYHLNKVTFVEGARQLGISHF